MGRLFCLFATLSSFAVILFALCSTFTGCHASSAHKYVKRFSRLNYDVTQHARRKRDANDAHPTSQHVVFQSHGRDFHLVLYPAGASVFAHSDPSHRDVDFDSFLFDGHLRNDPKSHVYGSLFDGLFDGHIYTGDGRLYHVEKAVKHYGFRPKDFHSLIYEDADIDYDKFRTKRSLGAKADAAGNDDVTENGETSESSRRPCGLDSDTQKWMRRVQTSGEQLTTPPKSSARDDYSFLEEHLNEDYRFRYRRQANEVNSNSRPQLQSVKGSGQRVYDVRACSMYMQADHKLYQQIFSKEGQGDDQRTREEILSLFYSHVKTVNRIYESTSFGGITGINFMIYNTNSCNPDGTTKEGYQNPFCAENVDVSNYLNLNSMSNHSAFCLAYSLTYRDFVGGTLGLAWVASPQPNTAGGICQIFQRYNERRGWVYRSLNTGIITLVNYGHRVPARVSQLTLAHEIGHNFGSPHDYPDYCQPGLPDGNYIMYASATSGDKSNNEKFSECSKANISEVLFAVMSETPVDPQKVLTSPSGGKRNCFSARTTAFCGNGLVEPGEECDCGFTEEDCARMGDRCCYPHKPEQKGAQGCTRKVSAQCSPSEGPCCNSSTCNFKQSDAQCTEEDECNRAQTCNGFQADCPEPPHKPPGTICQENTKICDQGMCNKSICQQVGLEECFITTGSPENKCQLACKQNQQCTSSFEISTLSRYYQTTTNAQGHSIRVPGIMKRPGSPCDNYKGYCDIFKKCRSVDSNGPLSRLRNFISDPEVYQNVRDWVQDHWWAVVLIALALILLLALFIKCCAVHTPSTNPNKPPAHSIYETLRHPSTLMRPARRGGRGAAGDGRGGGGAPGGNDPGRAEPRARSAARNRAERHRHRHRPEGSSAPPPPGPVPMQPQPLVPPSEPPPPYLAAVHDPVVSHAVPPGGPKRGHRKHRRAAEASGGNNVEMRANKRT